jgi:hypothetical protein
MQAIILMYFFTQLVRDIYEIHTTTIIVICVGFRIISWFSLFILQWIYLIKYYSLYGEACLYKFSAKARALRFLLYFILVINTVNSTSYNIFDLVNHTTDKMPFIIPWGKVTDVIYEVFMILDGVVFLIIFK